MSGIPIPKFGSWATEVNYGTGYSAGLPTKVAPVGDVMIPNTAPSGPAFNWILNAIASDRAALASAAIAGALNQWSAIQAASGISSGLPLVAASWDVAAARWLAVSATAGGGGGGQIVETLDGGRTWAPLQTFSGVSPNLPTGIACANNAIGAFAGPALVTMPASSGSEVCVLHPNDTQSINAITGAPATVATPFALQFPFASGVVWGILAANQSGGTFTAGVFIQTSDGATFNVTPIGIGNWAADTNHVGQFLAVTSGTTILAALCGATAGTDTARLMTITASGLLAPVFTDLSSSTSFLAGSIITGIAYDGVAWGVLTYNGTDSLLTTSGDLATWTLQKLWTGVKCSGLATVGSVWAVGVPYSSTIIAAGARVQICTNIDANIGVVGQAVFSWTPSGFLDAVPLPLAFVSSTNGLLAASAAKVQVSAQFAQL